MTITRYRPATEPFNSLLDDVLVPFARMGSSMRMPETDVVERQNEIRVVCELPGMQEDQVEVSMENNVLTISGEKSDERVQGQEGDTYHLSERRWGRFSRSFVLPREVDQERIEAEFRNGVLTVTIPKSEKARRRRIEVRPGQPAVTNGHSS
ncbi:MAG TPA: Hsp20/alpha crystallin family protein [Longimicrobiales bacterium]